MYILIKEKYQDFLIEYGMSPFFFIQVNRLRTNFFIEMEHATEQYHLYTCIVVYKHMQIHTFIQSNIFVKILTLDILLFIRVFSA